MKKLSLLIMLFLFLRGILNATTYYIDNAAVNDSHSGTSPDSAWKTINKINISHFNSGDTISFKKGCIWYEQLAPQYSNLTFNSYGNGVKPTIDGSNTRYCLYYSYNSTPRNNVSFIGIRFIHGFETTVLIPQTTYFTFDSCNIESAYGTNYRPSAPGMILAESGNHLTIRNSSISYGVISHGIYINGCSETLLEHDTIQYNRAVGINIGYTQDYTPHFADSVIVRYCIIKENGDAAIYDDGCQKSNFYYNRFENSSLDTNSALIYISENTAYDSVGIAPNNNAYYNNTCILHGNTGNIAMDIGGGNPVISHINNITIKNNIFYVLDNNSRSWYFRGTSLGSWIITNNIYYVNGSGYRMFHKGTDYNFIDWKLNNPTFEINSLFGDPLFDSNYTLKDSSPAVFSGVWVGLPPHDIRGDTVANPPDIGAYQNSTYLSGNISINTTKSGNVNVNGNVTISSGVNLTLSAGAHFRLSAGAFISALVI